MEVGQVLDLVNAGGTSALAIVVWLELREHRKELKAHREQETKTLNSLETLIGTVKNLVEGVLKRFTDEDAAKAAEAAASKVAERAAQDAARRVREYVREEISEVHERAPVGPDDDTPIEGALRAKREKPRAATNPYSIIKKPDKDR